MKTAISISDTLFEKTEKTAHYMGITRSRLFVITMEEYIAKHNGDMITEKLNEVYEKIDWVVGYIPRCLRRGSSSK